MASREYEIFRKAYARLHKAVQPEIDSLVVELYTNDLIGCDARDAASVSARSAAEKANAVMIALDSKVKTYPPAMNKLLDVLRYFPSVKELTEELRLKLSAVARAYSQTWPTVGVYDHPPVLPSKSAPVLVLPVGESWPQLLGTLSSEFRDSAVPVQPQAQPQNVTNKHHPQDFWENQEPPQLLSSSAPRQTAGLPDQDVHSTDGVERKRGSVNPTETTDKEHGTRPSLLVLSMERLGLHGPTKQGTTPCSSSDTQVLSPDGSSSGDSTEDDFAELDKTFDSFKERIAKLKRKLKERSNKVKQMKRSHATLQEKLSKTEKCVEELSSEKAELERKLFDSEELSDQRQDQLTTTQQKLEKYKLQTLQYHGELLQTRKRNQELEAQIQQACDSDTGVKFFAAYQHSEEQRRRLEKDKIQLQEKVGECEDKIVMLEEEIYILLHPPEETPKESPPLTMPDSTTDY